MGGVIVMLVDILNSWCWRMLMAATKRLDFRVVWI